MFWYSATLARAAHWAFRARPGSGSDPRLMAINAYLAANSQPEDFELLVFWIRRRFEHIAELRIEPEGNEIRAQADGLEFSARCLVPYEAIMPICEPPGGTHSALRRMAPMTLAILILRIRHDISADDIANRFGLRRRTVRRHLRLAIRAAGRSLHEDLGQI